MQLKFKHGRLKSCLLIASLTLGLAACGGGGNDATLTTPAPDPTSAPKAWQTAQLIETNNAGDANQPRIAFDANGNAQAVWSQIDGPRSNIWANRYTAGSGWGVAELIETDAGSAVEPQISIDSNGNALAIWTQNDGSHLSIFANRYTSGSGWGTAELIETENAGNAFAPQITIDPSGNALAVWGQFDGTRDNIWANRYTAGAGWGTAELIETDNAGDARAPQIAIDPSGNALAVWQQFDGIRFNILANRYIPGAGWGTAELIEADNTSGADKPQISIDAGGNALAVWLQRDGSQQSVFGNRYTAGTGWGTAELIETDNSGLALALQIAMDANGNGLAVWSQSDGTQINIVANRFTAGTGWGTAELIETDNTGITFAPQVAIDINGNAIAVWTMRNGARIDAWANRYTAGAGWGTAELIENDNTGSVSEGSLAVAMDKSGNGLAVWAQSNGTRINILSNSFR